MTHISKVRTGFNTSSICRSFNDRSGQIIERSEKKRHSNTYTEVISWYSQSIHNSVFMQPHYFGKGEETARPSYLV